MPRIQPASRDAPGRNHFPKRIPHLDRHVEKHGGFHNAGRNRHDANAELREQSAASWPPHHLSKRRRQPGRVGLRKRQSMRCLRYATLAVAIGIGPAHDFRGDAEHVETAIRLMSMTRAKVSSLRAFPSNDLLGWRNTGAIHQAAQSAHFHCGGTGVVRVRFIADVGGAECLRQGLARCHVMSAITTCHRWQRSCSRLPPQARRSHPLRRIRCSRFA